MKELILVAIITGSGPIPFMENSDCTALESHLEDNKIVWDRWQCRVYKEKDSEWSAKDWECAAGDCEFTFKVVPNGR